jgi:hypothetical protein
MLSDKPLLWRLLLSKNFLSLIITTTTIERADAGRIEHHYGLRNVEKISPYFRKRPPSRNLLVFSGFQIATSHSPRFFPLRAHSVYFVLIA